MACLSTDGKIAASGRALLELLDEPRTPEIIAKGAGNPLFMVRSSLREMVAAGLVEQRIEGFLATAAGRAMVS